jgi:hypothetical protein
MVLLSFICSIFHALIRCIKCVNDKQMHFNFIDIPLLYYRHQQVSASGVIHAHSLQSFSCYQRNHPQDGQMTGRNMLGMIH